MAQLIRSQRRASLFTATLLLIPLLAIPAFFALAPTIAALRPFGLPSVAWLILSPCLFPFFILLGRRHERRAEELETEWIKANQ